MSGAATLLGRVELGIHSSAEVPGLRFRRCNQACEPKSLQSLPKLDRRTRIVHAFDVSESCERKLRDRKPSLFNACENYGVPAVKNFFCFASTG
jgi:hypothetical protein